VYSILDSSSPLKCHLQNPAGTAASVQALVHYHARQQAKYPTRELRGASQEMLQVVKATRPPRLTRPHILVYFSDEITASAMAKVRFWQRSSNYDISSMLLPTQGISSSQLMFAAQIDIAHGSLEGCHSLDRADVIIIQARQLLSKLYSAHRAFHRRLRHHSMRSLSCSAARVQDQSHYWYTSL
jgi:hypothetical protein